MAKRVRRSFRRFRSRPRSHRSKLTPIRIMKWAIGISPALAYGHSNYAANGVRGFVSNWVSAYTGYDIGAGKIAADAQQRLTIGYLPLLAAWIFGKVASRVLR